MEFRRKSQRDERRRRVLLDETDLPSRSNSDAVTARDKPLKSGGPGPAKSYTEAALAPHRPRVVDLIPTRAWTIGVLLLLAVTAVTGLQALYGYVALGYGELGIDHVRAADLASAGSIASWFASCLLLASAMLAGMTYSIRRHRADDYRGRYRIWCWMVPILVVFSLDAVADLQCSLRTALLQLAGIPDYSDAKLVWTASVAVLGVGLGVRLAVEMRACRGAILSLVLAAGSYAVWGVATLEWLWADGGVFRVMALSALAMAGNVAVFSALCWYARHVYRDARGLLPVPPRAVRGSCRSPVRADERPVSGAVGEASSEPAASRPSSGQRATLRRDRSHHPPGGSAPQLEASQTDAAAAARRKKRQILERSTALESTAAEPAACGNADEEPENGGRKLSKAQRRVLRKQRRRELPAS
jgi:hypothetical protein